ncbi:hypothetical protein GQF01_25565 [Paenibacillus sp. 5J-6]|uniref:Uncharacterized protein n=1 Tax=Paenibacillus silvestris TaxID=2606219 RepID=A0A6L8V7A5_9BACL|nr:hypothetical protein [Paenibacillus silvestris]MZQ85491.1 hypothetical protein [Paenibacillus silvestris]
MSVSPRYYLGLVPHLFNPIHLDYEWFGVLWREEDNRYPTIVGYWFSKEKSEITQSVTRSGFSKWIEKSDHHIITNMYTSIRNKKKKQDWEHRTRLPILTIFKSPWSEVPSGMYILKSRDTFPLHASAVCKKRFFVWLEHSAVCENEGELQSFMKRVQEDHQIETLMKNSSLTVR